MAEFFTYILIMSTALVDERISVSSERGLLLRGFRVIKIPAEQNLGVAVKSHPDMILFHHKNKIITTADYCEKFSYIFSDIREYSDTISFTFTDDSFSPKYPGDVIFNALTVNNKIFLKKDSISNAVIEYAKSMNMKIVHVNQGYPACVTLAFKNSAVTADYGMAKVLRDEGIKVTFISNGDISLPPHEYGFIGGASGAFGDTVYFLGNIDLHRDREKIKSAIQDEGMKFVSLSNEPLSDLGRIIFID